MPDYFKVEPDVTRLMNKHFTPGRGGRSIKYVVRHHNAGVNSIDSTWNTWQTREASAHYQIEPNGRVGQLVNDSDTAWANADTIANQESLTIEHSNSAGAAQDWPISDATIDAGAKWAAALCWYYKLGRPQYGKNIRDHRDFYATSCPYHLANGGKYHARYMRTAQDHYDWMAGGGTPVVNEIDAEAKRAAAWLGKRITKGEVPTPDGDGRFAQFEHGYVYWHPRVRKGKANGDRAIAVPMHVFESWAGLGWEAGVLGYPVERHAVIQGVGDVQAFEGGVLYRRYGQPGYFVGGKIGDRYAAERFEQGPSGWPVGNEEDYDGGRRQRFEHRTLYWPNPKYGVVAM
ncbi:lysin A [Gordonia phage Schmidt]|uniref:N-acetylmuramoyl-L-alanine amidase n=1 Tax=Gordonia phage Schmidt TaxID=2301697 RepID=A0A385E048_9CAUD|nr:endolysin [Gordonia phage Schmidt]AXQ65143.1 lysin A [Gordonia phage Schmidt]